MNVSRRLTLPFLLGLGGFALAACITLLPKDQPVQLYRFGEAASVAPGAGRAGASHLAVAMANTDFARAAAGERILTARGEETGYLKGARWVSPAPILFDAAVVQAFDADGGVAHLLARGEPAHADYTLKLDVRVFEARYQGGAGPTARVEVYAALGSLRDHVDHERIFVGEAPAAENRLYAIAGAFDQALAKVLTQLVAWVDARGEG
jgi:cholesterol transport system auxiliary component